MRVSPGPRLVVMAAVMLMWACSSPSVTPPDETRRTAQNAESTDPATATPTPTDETTDPSGEVSTPEGDVSPEAPPEAAAAEAATKPCPMKAEGDKPEPLTQAAAEFPYPPVYSFSTLIDQHGGREFAIIVRYGDGSRKVDVLWQPQASEYCLPLEIEKGSFRLVQQYAERGRRETTTFQTENGGTRTSWTSGGQPRSPDPEFRDRWKEVDVMGHTAYMQEWDPDREGPEPWQIRSKGNEPIRFIYWSVDAPDNQYVHWKLYSNPRIYTAESVLQALNEMVPVYPE